MAALEAAGYGNEITAVALRKTLSDKALGCDEVNKLIDKAHPTK